MAIVDKIMLFFSVSASCRGLQTEQEDIIPYSYVVQPSIRQWCICFQTDGSE